MEWMRGEKGQEINGTDLRISETKSESFLSLIPNVTLIRTNDMN